MDKMELATTIPENPVPITAPSEFGRRIEAVLARHPYFRVQLSDDLLAKIRKCEPGDTAVLNDILYEAGIYPVGDSRAKLLFVIDVLHVAALEHNACGHLSMASQALGVLSRS